MPAPLPRDVTYEAYADTFTSIYRVYHCCVGWTEVIYLSMLVLQKADTLRGALLSTLAWILAVLLSTILLGFYMRGLHFLWLGAVFVLRAAGKWCCGLLCSCG